MKHYKKIIVISIIILCFSCWYIYDRKKANNNLTNVVDQLPSYFREYATEDFIDEYEDVVVNYKFRTNSEIYRIADHIKSEIENKTYCKEEYRQLLDSEIEEHVNYFNKNSNNYNVGKIFIYTKYNLGNRLEKGDGYVDCTIYTYNLSDTPIVDSTATVKIRGNSTSRLDKKPYNIKFSKKQDIYAFGESKKWSLLADAMDPTMLRNRISLDLARNMGLDYTSNCEYIELWFDDEYLGNYLLTESVETGKNRVDIDIDEGDFLFEYESERQEDDVTYIETTDGWRFALSDPEEPNDEQLLNISNKIQELNDAINSNDYVRVLNEIDEDSFAKLYVLNEFAKTVDFAFSSVNFYCKNNKFYAGPAWDFDLSFGNKKIDDDNYWITELDGTLECYNGLRASNNLVFNSLLKYPEFKAKVKEYYDIYRSDFEHLYLPNGTIDELLAKYGNLIKNNYASKQAGGAGWNFIKYLNLEPFETYEENVKYLKYWIENRLNFLDTEFKSY